MRSTRFIPVIACLSGLVAAAPAEARVPSTSTVETKVEKAADDRGIVFVARADCYRSGSRSWSCQIITAKDINQGNTDGSYRCTARYSGGHIYVGAIRRVY